ncbi:tRNA pseudouridine(38-40) synthase TruA [Ornithinimicrobium sp. W1665]|uniref:tRNA pseudouridine(38-40) synthase TruA n=1 Tax=Ornithinimicrobium sp. W1665 TaxID=3416666 RepID=UPI003CEFB848
MRIRIDLAYDGTDFSGWARQPGRRTVEEELGRALTTVLRRSEVRLTVGGRTDAGVHARGSVCHLDLDPDEWAAVTGRSARVPAEALVSRLRGVLPPDVVVRSAREVPDTFDARFSAVRRRYTYRLCDDPTRLDPLRRRDTVVWRHRLDEEAMTVAVDGLVGLHDFGAYCRPREGASTVRHLQSYRWERDDDGTLRATLVADAFCHSMVRALVGGAVAVGEGRRPTTWPREVLERGVRDPGVQVMPAHGLCLEAVEYPDTDEARAARAAESRAVRGPVHGPGRDAR